MNKRFKTISLHPWTGGCNLKCSFCYVKDKVVTKETKNHKFWYGLPRYIKRYSNQVSCGASGEPFMDKDFIFNLSKICKVNNLIFNVTTNGRLLLELDIGDLKKLLKYIDMVSISMDNEKVQTDEDFKNVVKMVFRINKYTKTKVACNLLVNDIPNDNLVLLVENLLRKGFSSVYALCPKNIESNVLKLKEQYLYLTLHHKNFYVDDLTNKIISEGKEFKTPCHYGKDLISIDKEGYVIGCSFDLKDKAIIKLDKPIDLTKIEKVKIEERKECPYLK